MALPVTLIALACGGAAEEDEDEARTSRRCVSSRDQIMSALQDSVNAGILISTAVPCGEDGIANRPDYFTSQVRQESVEYLQTSFREACENYAAECSEEDLAR